MPIGDPSNWVIIGEKIDSLKLAIRGSAETTYSGGAGYNISTSNYQSYDAWIAAVLATLNFAQDCGAKYILLLQDCAITTGEKYTDYMGKQTLPKSHALGYLANVVAYRDLGGRTDYTADWVSNYIAQHDFSQR